jgi:hypothetical protein
MEFRPVGNETEEQAFRRITTSLEAKQAIADAKAQAQQAEQAALQRDIDENHRRSGKPSYFAPQALGVLVVAVWIVHRIRIESFGHADPWWLTYALGTGASLTIALFVKTQHQQQAWNDADDMDLRFWKRNRRVLIVAFLLAQWLAFAVSYDSAGLGRKTAIGYGLLVGALVILTLVVGAVRGTVRLGQEIIRHPVRSFFLTALAAFGVFIFTAIVFHGIGPDRGKAAKNADPRVGGTTVNAKSP